MILAGDCIGQMRTLEADSVDAIVTDPPYGLEFMGKDWDGFGTPLGFQTWTEQWAREALRVLKPGGHLLAFGGTRMYHRLAAGIEDAGFEIRDTLMWLYGSGFPKSLDVSKAIDKMDAKDEQQARRYRFTKWVRSTGITRAQVTKVLIAEGLITENGTMAGHFFATSTDSQPAIMNRSQLEACRHLFGKIPDWVERECDIRSVESKNFAEREVTGVRDVPIGHAFAGEVYGNTSESKEVNITAPSTEAAKKWEGWGTALKPAVEPIVLARKPLIGTVAENVLTHGTGALNIDASRIGTEEIITTHAKSQKAALGKGIYGSFGKVETHQTESQKLGRWPANILLDEAAAALLDEQSGVSKSLKNLASDGRERASVFGGGDDKGGVRTPSNSHTDFGGASRFFYVAKASRSERNKGLERNIHPTVKPVQLMRYLIRLVTPKGGTVLDPFLGSGTTAVAAIEEGVAWIGCEREPEYLDIIRARVAAAQPGLGLTLNEPQE